MERIRRLFLMAALLCCLTACSGGSARAVFLESIAVSEIPAGNGVTQSAELRAVRFYSSLPENPIESPRRPAELAGR